MESRNSATSAGSDSSGSWVFGVDALDRRHEPRRPTSNYLWLIDNRNATVIPCRCEDASSDGLKLRVPAGFGVQPGRHYELSSHLPGQSTPPGFNLNLSRRATVVRADALPESDEIDVGVQLGSRRKISAAEDRISGDRD